MPSAPNRENSTKDVDRSAIILNRFYLEDEQCDPAYRGMGRFLRDMREAGFGALRRDPEILAVDAITRFTRYRGDLRTYTLDVLMRDRNHIRAVAQGFDLLQLPEWHAGAVALYNFIKSLGEHSEIITSVRNGHPQFRILGHYFASKDIQDMSVIRADWLRERPEARIVPAGAYSGILRMHIAGLRKARRAA